LQFANHTALAKKGRNFNCAKCPQVVQDKRRCWEDRYDFTAEDSNIFPIRIHEGGSLFGFCPAKVTRDSEAIFLFNTLIVACETGAMLTDGGISRQPRWFIHLLSWFLPAYDTSKFMQKAQMIMGDGADNKSTQNAPKSPRGKR